MEPPKKRLLDPPVYIITFYNIQPKSVNTTSIYHVYTFPLRTYGTVPKYPAPAPKQTVLAAAGIRRIPLSPDPALLPSPPLLGVSRVTAVQIHPAISCSVRAGSTRQTVPRNRPPRCGFTQQSKRDRSATWWPGDIHNRPSVRGQNSVRVLGSAQCAEPSASTYFCPRLYIQTY